MHISNFQWQGADGVELFGKEWSVDKPSAVVILVHGMGEHSGRYEPLANFLTDNNITLASYDQRGHGQTKGKRGHTPSGKKLWEDLDQYYKAIKAKYPKTPLFLYGHSMGGNVVLNYLLNFPVELNGAIVTGPWIKLTMEPPKALLAIGKLLRNILPAMQQDTQLDANNISTIPEEVAKYKNDPLIHGKITFAMAADTIKAGDFLDTYAGEFPVPLLIMHGGADPITSKEASKRLAGRITSEVTFKEWPGNYHEIHYDKNQKEVFNTILSWIKAKL